MIWKRTWKELQEVVTYKKAWCELLKGICPNGGYEGVRRSLSVIVLCDLHVSDPYNILI